MGNASNVFELKKERYDDLDDLVDRQIADAKQEIVNTEYPSEQAYLDALAKAREDSQRYYSYSYIALKIRDTVPLAIAIGITKGVEVLDSFAAGNMSRGVFETEFASVVPDAKGLIADVERQIDLHKRNNLPRLDFVEGVRAGLMQMRKMFPDPR